MRNVVIAILAAGGLVASAILYTAGDLSFGFLKPEWEIRLESRLFDAESAQYRNVEISELTGWICGEVNSKNRLGAYAGWKKFMVRPPFELDSRPDLQRDWAIDIEGDYAAVVTGC
ncbi:MAG: hypothetical protein ACSHXW_11685 [Yoonia sp.]